MPPAYGSGFAGRTVVRLPVTRLPWRLTSVTSVSTRAGAGVDGSMSVASVTYTPTPVLFWTWLFLMTAETLPPEAVVPPKYGTTAGVPAGTAPGASVTPTPHRRVPEPLIESPSPPERV